MSRSPSARLRAHVAASLLGLALSSAFWAVALWVLAVKGLGPFLAVALLALAAQGARPGPSADLDKEAGRGD